ncbi:sensor histidine kinase [Paenibacillus sp. NPDC058071]|uniref:sensor histidine kinase n=1 Tax=Paenibacillus sp. NPDC058071 TaxID=3346326 RepID=UPI0036DDD7CD
MINGVVIGIAIWLAGVSVKDYACVLFTQYPSVNAEESAFFAQTMQGFLLKASIWAVVVAGIIHYFFVKRLLYPLEMLGKSTKQMAQGEAPEPLPIHHQDEIGQLTADFNYLSKKLRQVEESRKMMVSDIAHELRTPLTNMNGYLEALSTGTIQSSSELFQSLHEESLRITRLVEQLHQLNVWQSKKLSEDTQIGSLSIDKVMATCRDNFALEMRAREMVSEWNFEAAIVAGDEDGLTRAMMNLLTNAMRYDLGGWVKVEGRVVGSFYEVTVINTGQPIPEEQAALVFERFYRLDGSRNSETGGSGLGLSLVREIIEQHHGQVGLRSQGNTHYFWFTVPVLTGSKHDS